MRSIAGVAHPFRLFAWGSSVRRSAVSAPGTAAELAGEPLLKGGDALVVFPIARVMAAGDIFWNKANPVIDSNNGGSAVAFPETLRKAAAVPNIDRVITGHGATVSLAELREYADYIQEFVTAVQAAKKAGLSSMSLGQSDVIICSVRLPHLRTHTNSP